MNKFLYLSCSTKINNLAAHPLSDMLSLIIEYLLFIIYFNITNKYLKQVDILHRKYSLMGKVWRVVQSNGIKKQEMLKEHWFIFLTRDAIRKANFLGKVPS